MPRPFLTGPDVRATPSSHVPNAAETNASSNAKETSDVANTQSKGPKINYLI